LPLGGGEEHESLAQAGIRNAQALSLSTDGGFTVVAAIGASSRGLAHSAWGAQPRVAWKGCGQQLECARVRVPLDWARRNGRTIKLAVIRHLASQPDERIGSMLFNPGGPGVSGE